MTSPTIDSITNRLEDTRYKLLAGCDSDDSCTVLHTAGTLRSRAAELSVSMEECRKAFNTIEKERDNWKRREHEARISVGMCELCPHLGHGDPLVDSVAAENVLLRKLEKTVAAYHATPGFKLRLQEASSYADMIDALVACTQKGD